MPSHLARAARLPLLLAAVAAPLAAQSPMFRADPAHSGTIAPPTLGPELQGLQWRRATGASVTGSGAVAGDTVWIGSSSGLLLALDRLTGATRWEATLSGPVSSTPAVAGGLVFVGTRDGRLHALSSHDGHPAWSAPLGPDRPLPWGHESGDVYTSSPVIAGPVVIIGSGDGSVTAWEATSGRLRWRAMTGGRVRSSPAVVAGTVYVGSGDGILYAYDLASGQERWRFATLGASLNSGDFGYDRRTIQSSPAVNGSTVVVGARDGFLYAVNTADGSLKWKVDHEISWVNGSPAIAGGVVYVGSSDGQFVQAVNLADGTERWRTKLGATVWSSATVSGDQLVIGDGSGRISALDCRTGAVRWSFYTGAQVWSSPVVAGNLVIAGSGDGGVYALRTGENPVDRVVYFDTSGVVKAAPPELETAKSLAARGYRVVGDSALVRFLSEHARDRASSVVVFAMEQLPPAAITAPFARSIFRQYLEHGGKVVWDRQPPLLFPRDPESGKRPDGGLGAFSWDAPGKLLGMDTRDAIFDRRMNTPSADGERWGLEGHWRDGWSVAPQAGITVLAWDDWRLAGAWVRSYGGPEGTGFVRGPDDAEMLYRMAEYRPGR